MTTQIMAPDFSPDTPCTKHSEKPYTHLPLFRIGGWHTILWTTDAQTVFFGGNQSSDGSWSGNKFLMSAVLLGSLQCYKNN